jgi:hypothetical protein
MFHASRFSAQACDSRGRDSEVLAFFDKNEFLTDTVQHKHLHTFEVFIDLSS